MDFQAGHFAAFEQFKIDSHFANFGQVKINPTCSTILLWEGHGYFTEFGQDIRPRKQSNLLRLTKNSRTTHRIWHKLFSIIRSVGIKNWVPQLINKLQMFSLLFLSIARFSDFRVKTEYA